MLLLQSQLRKSKDIFNLSKKSFFGSSLYRTIHIEKTSFPKLISCNINNNYNRDSKRLFSDVIKLDKKIYNYINKNNSINNKIDNDINSNISNDNILNLFRKLGLSNEIIKGLTAQDFSKPTPVQEAVIPRLLIGENILMAASTGSGKTLAFILPAIHKLLEQEKLGYKRNDKRPRCLILVPTRELAKQILNEIKQLSHFSKISSTAVLGGEQYGLQKKALDRLIDVVVASPGRLIQHHEQGNVYFSQVSHVIIDEVDTMLTQGFGANIRTILRSVMTKRIDETVDGSERKPAQLVMATATLTKAVRSLLGDIKDHSLNVQFSEESDNKKKDMNNTQVAVNIVEVDGVHRSLPHVNHSIEETKGRDKIIVLNSVINKYSTKDFRTLIFCNTVDSCRAVEYALAEGGELDITSYHGDLNSRDRDANLVSFRNGDKQYMVCTDIAARGLDIPEIDHVIMFDFPLNPVDYIHRSGRCGRAGRIGLVTSIITKRDKVLSDAIQGAVSRGLPIDNLTSSKKDYRERGKLAKVVGNKSKYEVKIKPKSDRKPKSDSDRISIRRKGVDPMFNKDRSKEKNNNKGNSKLYSTGNKKDKPNSPFSKRDKDGKHVKKVARSEKRY